MKKKNKLTKDISDLFQNSFIDATLMSQKFTFIYGLVYGLLVKKKKTDIEIILNMKLLTISYNNIIQVL